MQVIIQSPNLQVSDKLQQLIQDKMNHLEKMYNRITRCVVVVKKEKDEHKKEYRIETQLAVPKKTLFVSERADNFELALYNAIDGLTSQLRRYKSEREEIW
jgi:ribosomal subunit interface protein